MDRRLVVAALKAPFDGTDLPGRHAGKVRDWYLLPAGRRLLVTTERLSAFDRILGCVPYKGQVLNELSAWWFEQTRDIVANHVISLPDPNALVAREAKAFPVEVVVRGFISGVTSTSLWTRYERGERNIYGYTFPDGLKKNQPLPEPIITPTTKAQDGGHDEPVTCAEVVQRGLLDAATWDAVQTAAIRVFKRGQELARKAGLILVDTKYEFGRAPDGTLLLIDEVHTPDSSRFWKADTYEARLSSGQEPENFDKEFIRLAYAAKGYRGEGTPPPMPDELWIDVAERYIAIFEKLTGKAFVPGARPVGPRLAENLRRAGVTT